MNDLDLSSSEEGEQAQLKALVRDTQALGLVRARLAAQRTKPSLEECSECGEAIPPARRLAVPGVEMCIHCQTLAERFKANYRQPGASTE
jgi:phage/conjugal plasmid C-4 type zinc finger TraR family protein